MALDVNSSTSLATRRSEALRQSNAAVSIWNIAAPIRTSSAAAGRA
jgi:hypothetical protein